MSSSYALDNASQHGGDHLTGLAGLYDPFTTTRIAGLLDLADKRCLEAGAGSGSIAVWLAEQVGPVGQVWATDIQPVHIPYRANLRVVGHDLRSEPLPAKDLDLIHTRMVLGHLPERDAVLERLVEALAPGGVLLVEEWNTTTSIGGVLHAPTPELAEAYTRYTRLRNDIFTAAGTCGEFAAGLHARLIDAGLTDVNTVVHAQSWTGGSPGSRHARATLLQFRPRLHQLGMTDTDIDQLAVLLDDPDLDVMSFPLVSTAARAPEANTDAYGDDS
jgi:SAM-dependent methyltransferase